MNAEYYVLDPTGNITILVSTPVPQDLQVRTASALMEREAAAEQVGFLSFRCGWPAANSAGTHPCALP